jgi:hypothetical protein
MRLQEDAMRFSTRWLLRPCCGALTLLAGVASAQTPGDDSAFELAVPPLLAGDGAAIRDRIMVLHAEDGFETKLVKGAPYQAEAVTEVVQTLADGNRIVRKTTAAVYRDGEGRTRREGHLAAIGPLLGDDEPRSVFLSDPVAGTRYHLDLEERVAYKLPAHPAFAAGNPAGHGRHGRGERVFFTKKVSPQGETLSERHEGHSESPDAGKTESLGTQTIEGVEAQGTRTRTVIAAGEIGNERPIEIVSERWYSSDLQVVVMSRHSDPRLGETTYRLTGLSRGEPDRSLFEVPADFKVSDEPIRKVFRRKLKSEQPE